MSGAQPTLLTASCAAPAVMSANEHTDTVFECIRGGAEDYLLKPVTKKEVQYIWQHVWRRQQQNAMRVPNIQEEVSGRHATHSVPVRGSDQWQLEPDDLLLSCS